MVVHDYMRKLGHTDLSFVQIGAHDGMHLDPLYPFVKKYHWRGLLVEPQPAVFEKLKANYASEPQLTFEQCAIVADPKLSTIDMSVVQDGLHPHSTMLASILPAAIINNTHHYPQEAQKLTVPAMTLEKLLREHNIHGMDFLQIDVEGLDYEILDALWNTPIRPAIIQLEHGFYGPAQLTQIYGKLEQEGYEMIRHNIDTICVYQSQDDFKRVEYEGLNFEGRKL